MMPRSYRQEDMSLNCNNISVLFLDAPQWLKSVSTSLECKEMQTLKVANLFGPASFFIGHMKGYWFVTLCCWNNYLSYMQLLIIQMNVKTQTMIMSSLYYCQQWHFFWGAAQKLVQFFKRTCYWCGPCGLHHLLPTCNKLTTSWLTCFCLCCY